MRNALSSEWLLAKYRRAGYITCAITVLVVAVLGVMLPFSLSQLLSDEMVTADTAAFAPSSMPTMLAVHSSGFLATVMLVFGVIMVAAEFQWGSWGMRFMQGPSRWNVLGAKFTVVAAWALISGVIALVVATLLAWLIVAVNGGEGDSGILENIALVTIALVCLVSFAWLGSALALLFRGVTWALVIGIAWLAIVETVVVSLGRFLAERFEWLPSSVFNALPLQAAKSAVSNAISGENYVLAFASLGTVLVWAIVLSTLGSLRLVSSDV